MQDLAAVDGQLVLDDTETEASDNTVPLPAITKRAMLAHRERQNAEQAETREVWSNEHGLVFTTGIGTPIDPRNVNRQFEVIRVRAGLPNVRLPNVRIHDMRHTVSLSYRRSRRRRTSSKPLLGMPTST